MWSEKKRAFFFFKLKMKDSFIVCYFQPYQDEKVYQKEKQKKIEKEKDKNYKKRKEEREGEEEGVERRSRRNISNIRKDELKTKKTPFSPFYTMPSR